MRPDRPGWVTVVPDGPVLVRGPVEVVGHDGSTATSDRFLVAVCVCRRSRAYPLCDTSHRRRVRATPDAAPPQASDPASAARSGVTSGGSAGRA
jgi:CDGSH-type Zn-finger protein